MELYLFCNLLNSFLFNLIYKLGIYDFVMLVNGFFLCDYSICDYVEIVYLKLFLCNVEG